VHLKGVPKVSAELRVDQDPDVAAMTAGNAVKHNAFAAAIPAIIAMLAEGAEIANGAARLWMWYEAAHAALKIYTLAADGDYESALHEAGVEVVDYAQGQAIGKAFKIGGQLIPVKQIEKAWAAYVKNNPEMQVVVKAVEQGKVLANSLSKKSGEAIDQGKEQIKKWTERNTKRTKTQKKVGGGGGSGSGSGGSGDGGSRNHKNNNKNPSDKGKEPAVDQGFDAQKKTSRVRKINNRNPINHKYAGQTYPLEKLPEEIRRKYPHSVPFTGTGHPDFSRYAKKKVQISFTGNRPRDNVKANAICGFNETPTNYTWHHHHDGKTMMLVPSDIHKAVKHTGGIAKIKGDI